MNPSRRKFIQKSVAGMAATGLASSFPSVLAMGRFTPSDQLNVALIGARNRGFGVLRQHLDLGGVKCLALCDVDQNVLDEKSAILDKEYGQKVKLYKDYRRLLEDKDIDAVIIGTPDHWHCLPTVHACQAGKDVYVEKPLANTIAECNVMVEATRRYNRIVQVGQQQRSGRVWTEVMDYIKSGRLGTLRKTQIWANFNYGAGAEKVPDVQVPSGVDYDLWLGPAPDRPYNRARFHGSWRHFWDYGGGLMTDWGVHLIDMALWAKDINTAPKSVLAYGSNDAFPEKARETFATMSVTYPEDDYMISWEHTAGVQQGFFDSLYGIAIVGNKGTIKAHRGGWELFPEYDGEGDGYKTDRIEFKKTGPDENKHMQDFIDAVKTRKEPSCPIEVGRNVAMYAHMANIAVRTGDFKLDWNDDKSQFSNSDAANQLVKPVYRKPWEFPKV